MAANFKIVRHRNSDNLHLKLVGDFDGSSALELLDIIETQCDNSNIGKIFVHTCGLSHLYPFAIDVFLKHFMTSRIISQRVIFTGKYGDRMAPAGSACYDGVLRIKH